MPAQPSRAAANFEQIRAAPDRFQFLLDMTTAPEPVFEDEWRDFKDVPNKDSNVKKIWYEALSGFANTSGGVLVWGLDARKDPATEIDKVVSAPFVDDVSAFHTRLSQLQLGANDPPVGGVEYLECLDPSAPPRGFLACFIPESPFRPHRSEHSKCYHMRVGDNFVVPVTSTLRLLFYPRLRSALVPDARVSFAQVKGPELMAQIRLAVRLRVAGNATASEPYVIVKTDCEPPPTFTPGPRWVTYNNPLGDVALESAQPLHPGLVVDLFIAEWQVRVGQLMSGYTAIPGFQPKHFELLLYARDTEPQRATFELPDGLLNEEGRIYELEVQREAMS
jgi:hypothetical protein